MRLLLLEDDRRLAELLGRGLKHEGYAVDVVGTLEDARWLAGDIGYDALILDVMLPDGDGFALCDELRAAEVWTPILLLTARDSVADRVHGLDVGADDYLVKPFAFDELVARIRALVRRGSHPRPSIIRVGTLAIDPARHEVSVSGRAVHLSAREFTLLELLARRAGDVLSRQEITEHVWDWAYEGTSNVVDVYVRYLRQKLAPFAEAPRIETVRSVGYTLRVRARDASDDGR